MACHGLAKICTGSASSAPLETAVQNKALDHRGPYLNNRLDPDLSKADLLWAPCMHSACSAQSGALLGA